MRRPLAALAALLFAVGPAAAHDRGTSYSDWTLDGTHAQVRLRISQLDLTRLRLDPAYTPDYARRVAGQVPDSLQLWTASGRCAPQPARATVGDDGWVSLRWTLACADERGYTIRSNLLHAVAPSHLHLARTRIAGAAPVDHVLTYSEPLAAIDAPRAAPASLGRYLALGVEHILSGWDHLAFVLALILLAARLRDVALVATGFTVAHSLTLAAAVLGWARVHAAAVEALIGLSILLVAAENLWLRGGRGRWLPAALAAALAGLALAGATRIPALVLLGLALFVPSYFGLLRGSARPLRLRVAIAFIFGLVHGFGFAGVLAELELPPERLALGLVGFNTGVELGQLLAIGLIWPVLKLLARRPAARHWVGDGASAGICALGAFWFVSRAFG